MYAVMDINVSALEYFQILESYEAVFCAEEKKDTEIWVTEKNIYFKRSMQNATVGIMQRLYFCL